MSDDGANATGQRSFVWPPRPVVETASVEQPISEPRSARRPRAICNAIASCEMYWLAPTAIPLRRRMAELAWAPNPFDAYCNRCGASIGPFESDDFGCAECRGEPIPWTRFTRLDAYQDEFAEWIRDLKFRGRRDVAHALGAQLAMSVQRAGLPQKNIAVTPVAMAPSRRFLRPFDHAHEIAHPAARLLKAPLVNAFRRKRRPSQRSVPASQRRANVRGSFLPRRGVDFTGWTVLLIDDVRTTGATLAEASRTLRRMGASEIWVGVLGVTPGRNRRSPEGDE